LANCERDIFTKHGSELLEAIGKEKFNFIDLGAGDADKTKILIRKGLEEGFDFNYIPVDISEDSNNVLVDNIKGISDKLNMFVVTAKFEEGIKWITENVKQKNAFFMVGSTIGCFEKQAAFEYFKWLGGFLRQGDMIIMGFDMKKDPKLIQNAYFGNPHEFEFIQNSIRRINKDLGANFNLDAFYPHSYFNPEESINRGCLIARKIKRLEFQVTKFNFSNTKL
jgi:L-histidine N-alpha-methyltransferase